MKKWTGRAGVSRTFSGADGDKAGKTAAGAMAENSLTIEAQSSEEARGQGALRLQLPPEDLEVTALDQGHYLVSVANVPGRFEIFVQADRLAAFLKVITPPRGNGALVSSEQVLQALAEKKILFGIDTQAIDEVVARVRETGKPETDICIARGEPARAGANGRVELKVGLGALNPDPTAADMVRPGQVVALLFPAQAGMDGTDVFGQVLAAKPGAERTFAAGANVEVSADGLTFSALIYGRAIATRENILVASLVQIDEARMAARLPIWQVLADNSRLAAEDVVATLAAAGVVHGIQEEAIAAALAAEESVPLLVAALGTPARDGVAARVNFAFSLHGRNPLAVDRARQTGVVTEKKLRRDLVVPGDLLARKVPLVPAEDGRTVTGEALVGRPAEDFSITAGEYVVAVEEGLAFVVADTIVAGYADYSNGVISVLDPVRVSEDGMQAFLTVHPPGRGGMGMTGELAARLLAQHQVVYGISDAVIRKAIAFAAEKNAVLNEVVVAKGILPLPGRDAEIELLVPVDKLAGVSLETGDRMNFRERSLIHNVKEGELLARKIPAEAGVAGHDVLGRELPAQAGEDKQLLAQANVAVSEDGLLFSAQIGGMLSLLDRNKIAVFQVYEVKGDVDYATGNLNMEGALAIKGWIRSGFTVRASGDVMVGGGVEDALILSGANVIIAGGVVCLEHGRIKAGGDVSVKFLERTRVHAGGNVHVHDEAMRSFVSAGGAFSAVTGKGRIRGGTILAVQGIEVNEVGSAAGVRTLLMAGTNPGLKRRIALLGKEINGYRRQRAKMDTVLGRYLGQGKGINLPREAARKLSLLAKQRRALVQAEARLARAREELARELAGLEQRAVRIVVRKAVYAGTTVVIGGKMHKVSEDIRRPVTFLLDDSGQVVLR